MKYALNVEFEDNALHEEVAQWLDAIVLPSAPEGTRATINLEETLRNSEDLSEEDIGRTVRFHAKNGVVVNVTLDAIYPSHVHEQARLLIVNGVGYDMSFGLVGVS